MEKNAVTIKKEELSEQDKIEIKQSSAIVSFIYSILSFHTGVLTGFIFAIIALAFNGKARGVKGTSYRVFKSFALPLSIVMLVLKSISLIIISIATLIAMIPIALYILFVVIYLLLVVIMFVFYIFAVIIYSISGVMGAAVA